MYELMEDLSDMISNLNQIFCCYLLSNNHISSVVD
jgi:hypothetical protein